MAEKTAKLIPVNEIFKETVRHIMSHKLLWLKVGFAPLVLFAIGELFAFIFLMVLGQTVGVLEFGVWHVSAFIIYAALSLILGSSFYLNGYRYGVLNEGGERWWHLPFTQRLFKIMVYSLLIGFIPGVLYILFYFGMWGLVLGVGEGIFWKNIWKIAALGVFFLFALYISLRLSFLFPMIALDRKNPLKASWQMTRGNVIRLGGLMLLISLTIAGILLLLALLLYIVSMIVPSMHILIFFWEKTIFFLTELPIVGLALEGLVSFLGNFFFGASTMMGGTGPFYTFFIVNLLLLPPILLITWVMFIKALSLVYLSLTKNLISH